MVEYSVEEALTMIDRIAIAYGSQELEDARAVLAERIKADEGAAPKAWRWRRHAKDAWHYDQFDSIEEMAAQEMRAKGWDVELLFTHPPARAAQVDESAALAHFTDYFVRNYPGPDTIIYDPKWHAPKIFRAAQYAIANATTTAPAAEPVAQGEVPLPFSPYLVSEWKAPTERHSWTAYTEQQMRAVAAACLAAQPRVGAAAVEPVTQGEQVSPPRYSYGADDSVMLLNPEDSTYTRGAPAASAAGVPDGWKLVPVELTDDMLAQACTHDTAPRDAKTDQWNRDTWAFMLAAAPSPGESE